MFRFSDKTKNDWSGRKKFAKVAGKYDMVKLDYTSQVSGRSNNVTKIGTILYIPGTELLTLKVFTVGETECGSLMEMQIW